MPTAQSGTVPRSAPLQAERRARPVATVFPTTLADEAAAVTGIAGAFIVRRRKLREAARTCLAGAGPLSRGSHASRMSKANEVGIPTTERQRLAEGLGVVLADTHTLYLTTHGYHWNVTGPMFPALHGLFEQQYNELWLAIDLVAERIRSLGHPAPFGCSAFARAATVHEGRAAGAMDMVADLAAGHQAVARTLRNLVPLGEKAGDQATLDLVARRLAAHEKAAWMLRATLQASTPASTPARRRGVRPTA